METTDDLRGRYCLTLDLDVETASYICTALDLADRIPAVNKAAHADGTVRYRGAVSRVQRLLRDALRDALTTEGGGDE